MNRKLRHFLQGAGSILVLMPAATPGGQVGYERQPHVNESIRHHWQRVGNQIRSVMEEEGVEAEGHQGQPTG